MEEQEREKILRAIEMMYGEKVTEIAESKIKIPYLLRKKKEVYLRGDNRYQVYEVSWYAVDERSIRWIEDLDELRPDDLYLLEIIRIIDTGELENWFKVQYWRLR